jgi:(1->4)-alpha-D-glucan 1-alpha-D-glucosylmutase
MNGHDIVDHSQRNPELGDAACFRRLGVARKLQGRWWHILHAVPHPMGVGSAGNPHLGGRLARERNLAYAEWLDIDWDSDRRYVQVIAGGTRTRHQVNSHRQLPGDHAGVRR